MIPIEELYQLFASISKNNKSPMQRYYFDEYHIDFWFDLIYIVDGTNNKTTLIVNESHLKQFYHLFTKEVVLEIEEELIKSL